MTLKEMAWKSLRRRKGKAAFVLLGLLLGVAAGVSLLTLTQALTKDIQHQMEMYGANILISPATEELSLSFGGLNVGAVSFDLREIRQEDLALLRSIPNAKNIAAVGPILLGTMEHQGKRVVLAGMDFRVIGSLRPWWRVQGEYPGEGQVLLGADMARLMSLGLGEVWPAGGLGWRVSGILESTGSQEDLMAFAPLAQVQAALGKEGRISLAEVAALCSGCPIEEMVRQISFVLPNARVQAIKQVVDSRVRAMEQLGRVALGLSGTVLLVGGLVVLVTMMGSVRDRTAEIGILRAIGFRRVHIVKVILMEAGMVSILAGILGYSMGVGLARLAIPIFSQAHGHHGAGLSLQPEVAVGSVAFSLALGLLASLYPALAASRLDPNEALRIL